MKRKKKKLSRKEDGMEISLDIFINGKTYTISPEVVNAVIVVIFLSIIAFIIGHKAKKADFREKPKGILLLAEIFVEGMQKLVEDTMGKGNQGFVPYMGTLALFLIASNLSGLVGLKPPTSNYVVPMTLALITTFLIHINTIRFSGFKGFVGGFFEPIPLLFPINVVGALADPISLSFRLFGNILSGVIITTLLYSALSSISIYIIPFIAPPFHAYFDIFAGTVQTFVFLMLTMVNVGLAVGDRTQEVKKN